MKKAILFVSVITLFIASCTFKKGELPKISAVNSTCDSTVHFYPTITNIISGNCNGRSCHGSGSSLDYTSYNLFLPHVTDGAVLKRVVNLQGNPMPAAGPIPDSLRNRLNCWIQQGALNN